MGLRFQRQKNRLVNWKLLPKSKPLEFLEFLEGFTIFFIFNWDTLIFSLWSLMTSWSSAHLAPLDHQLLYSVGCNMVLNCRRVKLWAAIEQPHFAARSINFTERGLDHDLAHFWRCCAPGYLNTKGAKYEFHKSKYSGKKNGLFCPASLIMHSKDHRSSWSRVHA